MSVSICSNKRYENEYVKRMIAKGYHCERIAGSGSGQNAVCDCILFRDGSVFLVEVKATKEAKFYYRKQIREQLEKMVEVAKESNVKALLAIKFKHRGWEERELL
jgi:Holliday junction resolvase